MCREKHVEPILDHDLALRMSRYLSWLYYQKNSRGKPLTAGVANACLTQLGALWTQYGKSWVRKSHPQLKLQLEFYKRRRPSDFNIRKPICYPLFEKLIEPLLRINSLTSLTLAAALCNGYYFGGRAGEYTCSNYTQTKGDVMLQHKHLKWSVKHQRITSLAIKFEKSKVNQLGDKTEVVGAECLCQQGLICAPHVIWRLFQAKAKHLNRTATSNDPVLYWESKSKCKALNRDKISNYIKNMAKQFGLNIKEYQLHSLRIGRASDLARIGTPRWLIAKWGRWASDCWELIYARLDFTDIMQLTGTPLNKWLASNSN